MCAKSLQSWQTLCDPVDCSLPVSSVYRTLQARILKGVVVPSSRGSSQSSEHLLDASCVPYSGPCMGNARTVSPQSWSWGVCFAHSDHGWINLDKAESLRQFCQESFILTQSISGVPWLSLSLQTNITAERTREKGQMHEFNDCEVDSAHPGQKLASSLLFHFSFTLPSYQIPYPTSTSTSSYPGSSSVCHSTLRNVCCVF